MKNSHRSYRVFTSQKGVTNIEEFNLEMLEESDSEVAYALQEQIDNVLDLKINESRYFQPNRDDYDSKAIITRIH